MTICPKNFELPEKDYVMDYDECEYLRKIPMRFIEAFETGDRDLEEFLKEWQKEHRKEVCREYLNAYRQSDYGFRKTRELFGMLPLCIDLEDADGPFLPTRPYCSSYVNCIPCLYSRLLFGAGSYVFE